MYDIDHKATRHLNHIVDGSQERNYARVSIMTTHADNICKYVQDLENERDQYRVRLQEARLNATPHTFADNNTLREENESLRGELEATHKVYKRIIREMES